MLGNKLWDLIQTELDSLGYAINKELTSISHGEELTPSNSKSWLCRYKDKEDRVVKVNSVIFSPTMGVGEGVTADERAQRERDLYNRLGEHPNIPAYKDFQTFTVGDIDLPIFMIATEYVNCPDVLSRLRKKQKLNEEEINILLKQSLSALNHVHTSLEEQVLHRDIKPSNILFDNAAYLIDFDFSKMGDATQASQFIQNSYYPADTYAKQTQSQDLVALGNVAICAGFGREIFEVRELQMKSGIEAIEVDGLSFSHKMKSFLRKLTSPNPALRYQTAQQAIEDLNDLDKITQESLDAKLTTINRSNTIKKLLDVLSKKDQVFNYNVPPNLRESYDDDALLDHLERIYSQQTFVIEDEETIEKFAQKGTKVIAKKSISIHDGELNHNDSGIVTKVGDGKATVKINNKDWEIELINLKVTHKARLIGSAKQLHSAKLAEVYEGNLKGCLVRYEGDFKKANVLANIPVDTEGMIVYKHWGYSDGNLFRDGNYWIIWENHPNVIQPWTRFRYHYENNFRPKAVYQVDSFKLVIPNNINFKGLYAKIDNQQEIINAKKSSGIKA